jgi:addiction module HigA family antidote
MGIVALRQTTRRARDADEGSSPSGDLIKTEIIDALGLTVSRAAEVLKVRRATLSDLLHGKAALTPEMGLRIEKAFGPDMNHLLWIQLAYDVAKVRAQAGEISVKR